MCLLVESVVFVFAVNVVVTEMSTQERVGFRPTAGQEGTLL